MFRNQFMLLALLVAGLCVGICAPSHNAWSVTRQLVFTTEPSNGTAGQTLAPIAVSVINPGGAVDTGSTAQILLTLSIGGTLNGTTTQTVALGVATFSDLSIDTAGTGYTLTATVTNPPPAVTGATSTPFDIVVDTATQLAFGVQPTDTPAGQYVNPAVTVLVQDSSGFTVGTDTGTVITISITLCGAPITLEAETDSAGIATFPTLRLNTVASADVLNATAPGLADARPSTAFAVTANPDRIFFDGFDDPACTP